MSDGHCSRCKYSLAAVGTLTQIDPDEHPDVWLCPRCETAHDDGEWSLDHEEGNDAQGDD